MSEVDMASIFRDAKTVAVVGLSSNPDRASNEVAAYLQQAGYRIIPVNPSEEEVLGETSYPSLSEVPDAVDVVDVFRRAEHTPPIAREAVDAGARVLWLQQGIVNDEAARIAREGGLTVVMDRCMRTVHHRLLQEGEL